MGVKMILPTAEIVQSFEPYEQRFVFYDDGIEGIVRDAVLHSATYPSVLINGQHRRPPYRSVHPDFLKKVQDAYERQWDLRHQQMTSSHGDPWDTIGLLVELVDYAVTQLMREFLEREAFNVNPCWHCWYGKDLCVEVIVWSDRNDKTHPIDFRPAVRTTSVHRSHLRPRDSHSGYRSNTEPNY